MEKTLEDLIQAYIGENRMRFEGEGGVANLEKLAITLGFEGNNFRYGSSIESFLADNPGAQEAIINWICEQNIPEWKDCFQYNSQSDDEEPPGSLYFARRKI